MQYLPEVNRIWHEEAFSRYRPSIKLCGHDNFIQEFSHQMIFIPYINYEFVSLMSSFIKLQLRKKNQKWKKDFNYDSELDLQ